MTNIFEHVQDDLKSIPVAEQAELIKGLAKQVSENSLLSNKFISFLQTKLDPIMAVYGYYYAIDEGLFTPTARNFQTTMLFEQEFSYLIKHLTPTKKTALYESVANGGDLAKIELELVSPFNLQPEDEIGTGTWEYVEPELSDEDDDTSTATPQSKKSALNGITLPLKDILDTAAKKVFGVGVKQEADNTTPTDRDEYYVYTQYLYQFTDSDWDNDTPTICVASEKFWEENGAFDDCGISEYLEDLIPDWNDHWSEDSESVFSYIGPNPTKQNAVAYLRATGFFKEHKMFEDEENKSEILLSYLDGQPEEVVTKFLKEALAHLDESVVEELIQKYEDGWHEDDE